MQKEINLLPRKNLGFLQKQQTVNIARALAIFSIIIVTSSFVGIFLLQKNYSLAAVQLEQENVHTRLNLLKDKAQTDMSVVNRVNTIQKILKTRTLLSSQISTIENKVPADISVDSLDISDTTETIFVSSPSLTSLKKFIDSLTVLVGEKKLFQKITINDVVVNTQTGKYTVSIEGVLL